MNRFVHTIDVVGPADKTGVWTQRVSGQVRIDNVEAGLANRIRALYENTDREVYQLLEQTVAIKQEQP